MEVLSIVRYDGFLIILRSKLELLPESDVPPECRNRFAILACHVKFQFQLTQRNTKQAAFRWPSYNIPPHEGMFSAPVKPQVLFIRRSTNKSPVCLGLG